MRASCGVVSLAAGLLLSSACTFADPIGPVSEIVAFGDSLSDSGNASIGTLGQEPGVRGPGYYYRSLPGLPFQVGEFTNAPTPSGPTGVWVDQLAPKLGVSVAQPFLPPVGGTNYGVGSAVTGSSGLVNIDSEVAAFTKATGGAAPSNALYTIWGGANDIFDIGKTGNPALVGAAAADNLYKNILTLSSEGARYFLWPNLPDLGKTPGAAAGGPLEQAGASLASQAFNTEYAMDLMKLQSDGISVVGLDVAALFADLQANPTKYGLTNVTGSAILSPTSDPNGYLFWDDVHPTAAADALLADAAFDALVSTPEPGAFALAGLGVCGLMLFARRAKL